MRSNPPRNTNSADKMSAAPMSARDAALIAHISLAGTDCQQAPGNRPKALSKPLNRQKLWGTNAQTNPSRLPSERRIQIATISSISKRPISTTATQRCAPAPLADGSIRHASHGMMAKPSQMQTLPFKHAKPRSPTRSQPAPTSPCPQTRQLQATHPTPSPSP